MEWFFSLKNNERTFRHTKFDYIADDKELIIIFESIGSYMELEDELELSLKTHNAKFCQKSKIINRSRIAKIF